MVSPPKHASFVKSTDETINAQYFTEQNTDKSSLTLEKQQACDPALVINGKGKATVHAIPFKWSYVKHLTVDDYLPQSTKASIHIPGIFEQIW
jgi:hypothetical protein